MSYLQHFNLNGINYDIADVTNNIATQEESSTASKAYAVGDYLIYNSQLYRVTSSISSGGTITVGTNVVATSVEEELGGKQDILISGTNIKTINNTSLLGSGNITISGGSNIEPASNTPIMDGTGAVGTSTKYAREDHVHPSDSSKVDAVSGKGLSTNDFTDTLKTKLDGIASGAEVNVQANWSETSSSSDAYIKNKPSIPSKTSDLTNDSGYITSSSVPSAATATPSMDGTGAVGTSSKYAKEDHVHPSDASKQDVLSSGTGIVITNNTVSVTGSDDISSIRDGTILGAIRALAMPFTRNPDTSDFNDFTAPGIYAFGTGEPAVHGPNVYLQDYTLWVVPNSSGNYIKQIAASSTGNYWYARMYAQGVWTDWARLDNAGDESRLADLEIGKQDVLVSGTSIKTINNESVLGSGDISIASPPDAATSNPLMDGTAAVGSSSKYAKEDHVHPTDTSRQESLVSGTNIKTVNGNSLLGSGDISISGADPATSTPIADGTGAVGTSTKYAREDHVHPLTMDKGVASYVTNAQFANVNGLRYAVRDKSIFINFNLTRTNGAAASSSFVNIATIPYQIDNRGSGTSNNNAFMIVNSADGNLCTLRFAPSSGTTTIAFMCDSASSTNNNFVRTTASFGLV